MIDAVSPSYVPQLGEALLYSDAAGGPPDALQQRRVNTHFNLPSDVSTLPLDDLHVAIKAHLMKYNYYETVELRGTELGDNGLRLLAEAVTAGGAQQLRSLSLSRTSLTPAGLIELLAAVGRHSPYLCQLDISDNALGDEVAEALRDWVPSHLTHLNLADTQLSSSGVNRILTAVLEKRLNQLESLTLCNLRLNEKTTETLGQILSGCSRASLKELRLHHCSINDVNSDALAEGLHGCAVELLDLSSNDCVIAFSVAANGLGVRLPPRLRILDLSHNPVKRALVNGLCISLQPSVGHLEELLLNHTLDGDESLLQLLAGLGCMSKLRVLDVSSCRLTYRSTKMLGQRLTTYPSLERLYLTDNLLDVEGITNLCSSLERLRTLTTLHVGSCYLGNCGSVAVVSSLVRGHAPVRELDLSNNCINDAGVRDVCTLLSRLVCPRLSLLVLSYNPCTKQSSVQLEEMMQERQSDCVVLARGTPLDDLASVSEDCQNSSITTMASAFAADSHEEPSSTPLVVA